MALLIGFAFLGGIVTILSPCILPVLPIVLSGSVSEGKRRPLGIIAGFILSFTFFTLFLTGIVNATGVSADSLRFLAIIILLLFGITLLIPALQKKIELLFSRMASRGQSKKERHGLWGGFLIGLSLGLLWTPCVGPILASVISLALTGSVTGSAALITFAYALGTAIPMFAIMIGGRKLMKKIPWLVQNAARIQQVFGVIMILTALAIVFNVDRKFQTYILEKFPSYGSGITTIEDNEAVLKELESFDPAGGQSNETVGQPLFDVNQQEGYPAPELIPGGEWFNAEPMTLQELKGKKIVMVDFWTYSCINCIRTLPYLNAWYEKYKDEGFEIIGVHTPEFEFEKDPDNVQTFLRDNEIRYPVMQDNNYETWRAYENRYWPRKYLVDIHGNIVYDHIGEGGYQETEEIIRQLLEEARQQELPGGTVDPENKIRSSNQPTTPEIYFGAFRNSLLANGTPGVTGKKAFAAPVEPEQNKVYLVGEWDIQNEYATNISAGDSIVLSYQAQNIYMVASADNPIEVRVVQGGIERNRFTVQDEKLYTVLEKDIYVQEEVTLIISSPGLSVFTLTFG